MKNGKCPKCGSDDIIRTEVPLGVQHPTVSTGWLSAVELTRYLCGQCCYTEQWAEAASEDVEKLRKRSL